MSSAIAWMRHHHPAGLARFLIVAVAVLAVSSTVIGRSTSAFTATTGNSGNEISAGNITLTDNDNGTALFSVTGLVPLNSQTSCIEVAYGGSIAPGAAIALYGSYVDGPDAGTTVESQLAPYLTMKVEMGAAGTTCGTFANPTTIYNSTLSSFTTTYAAYGSGLVTWTPTVSTDKMRAFKITATLQDNNLAMGLSAEPAFTWEVRSA